MTKTLITTSALAALLAASALTPAFAQTREAADQTQGDRTGGAYVDDLIIGARAQERRGAAVWNPDQRDDDADDEEGAAASSEFARTLTPNGGGEQANAVMPHHTTLDDLRPAAASQAETRPRGEWSRVLNTAAQNAHDPLPVEELTLGYTEVEWTYARGEENKPETGEDAQKQRRVRAQQEEPAALLLPAVQSAREAARRSNGAASSSSAGVVDDGLDTDSDGCGAAMQSGRGRARARATVGATAGQEGGGLWNDVGPAAASDQGGGGIFNYGGTVGADTDGEGLSDLQEVTGSEGLSPRRGHDNWITLDSVQLAARCAAEAEAGTRVRRGMQELKH